MKKAPKDCVNEVMALEFVTTVVDDNRRGMLDFDLECLTNSSTSAKSCTLVENPPL